MKKTRGRDISYTAAHGLSAAFDKGQKKSRSLFVTCYYYYGIVIISSTPQSLPTLAPNWVVRHLRTFPNTLPQ